MNSRRLSFWCARIVSPLLLLTVISERAAAHPYLPLSSGSESTLAYSFRVDEAKFPQKPVNGTIRVRNHGAVQKEGRTYFEFHTSYQDIPYMTEEQRLWRREERGEVFMGSTLGGKWSETVELPANCDLGSTWEYFDGERSRRTVTKRLALTLPKGEVLSDCIEVTRAILGNERLKNVVNREYYCRDVGSVRSEFIQTSPIGTYRTETQLEAFQVGAAQPPQEHH